MTRRRAAAFLKFDGQSSTYVLGRIGSALTQIALAAAVTRVLPAADLGRFAAALSTSMFTGIFFASSVRRLAMYRDESADLADIKVAAAIGGAVGAASAAAICWGAFDARTAAMAALLGGLRAADGYAEVGQAVWCQQGRFARAGRALLLRTGGATAITIVLLPRLGLVGALAAGVLFRSACAAAETARARRQRFVRPTLRAVSRTLGMGSWISVAAAAILAVDTLPTLLVTRMGGFGEAALLAPLGRIRFGVVLVATTLVEVAYPEMARLARQGRPILPSLFRPVTQFGLGVALAAPVAVFGGAAAIFGERLSGHESLISLAILSGAMMGICNLVSAGLTAQARILPQIVSYGGAAAVAVGVAYSRDWSLGGMLFGQAAGCALSLVLLAVLGYARSNAEARVSLGVNAS